MSDDPFKDLGRRLDQARRALDGPARKRAEQGPPDTANALAMAWRIGLELVVAILVGTGLGWAIDRWLGTRPWGMIILFFLGVAAGMLNVWRTVAGMGMGVGYGAHSAAAAKPRDGGGDEEDEDGRGD
jgi:ATP synthase protein I